MSVSNPFPVSHWAQQSPIKLFKAESLFVQFPKHHLSLDYQDAPFAGQFVGSGGHSNFELTKPHAGAHPPVLTFGGVKAELVKIHLHMPSEHDPEGINQEGEIHLIHKIDSPASGSTLIVLGVFFAKTTKAAKGDVFQVWASEQKATKKSKSTETVHVNARKLLPSLDKWYYYQGSLTSEPYDEIVTWVVFSKALGVSGDDLNRLKKHAHQPERGTQDINRRFVIRNFS